MLTLTLLISFQRRMRGAAASQKEQPVPATTRAHRKAIIPAKSRPLIGVTGCVPLLEARAGRGGEGQA